MVHLYPPVIMYISPFKATLGFCLPEGSGGLTMAESAANKIRFLPRPSPFRLSISI